MSLKYERSSEPLHIYVKKLVLPPLPPRFQGGLVFKAHRLLHHSSLGLFVIQKKKSNPTPATQDVELGAKEIPLEYRYVIVEAKTKKVISTHMSTQIHTRGTSLAGVPREQKML